MMAKNTVLLYFRLIVTMLISIYISRLLLNVMGVNNFGIFSVVSSSVTMFSFINNSLAYGTQRFITYELGKRKLDRVRYMFIMSLNIHLMLSVIIFIVGVIAGYILIFHYLTIDINQVCDSYKAFLILLIGFFISFTTTPYSGVLIATEKFNVIALLGIAESVMKLIATILLYYYYNENILSIYAFLLLVVTLIIRTLHIYYAQITFKFCRLFIFWDKNIFKEMFSFSAWGLFGGISSILMNQGINIILNIAFNPAVNAARALAFQINSAISQFSSNLQMVFRPRIIKSYASGDIDDSLNVTLYGAKYNYLMMLYIIVPVWVCTGDLLLFWLDSVPEYTFVFTRYFILVLLIESLSGTIMAIVSATGNIKKYQVFVGTILLLNLPLSSLAIYYNYGPAITVYIQLFLSVMALIMRLIILDKEFVGFIKNYLTVVIYRIMIVTLLSFVIVSYMFNILNDESNFLNIIIALVLSTIVCTINIFLFGLNEIEKKWIIKKVSQVKVKFK